ncbi:unnamed protein product [Spirodela intermedia]|uniref:Protein kinase domain-containing protein n=1 Tax=Spirodela intermedia TaxID=51605 RepID=A0A7I8J812_SPIIN|nr:unnamed protein product [Spirodela intermedia]CAA6665562.1 unnamed protein product [Spirodela intermedia]
MEHVSEKKFPVDPKDYKLYEEIGDGVSATVYRALCIPYNEVVAIKILDLEKCNNDLDGIRHEVKTMSLINHPNLLNAHCSFTSDMSLWVVMPYFFGGSCLHIMKYAHLEGFEEPVIATLLREVLKALVYLHGQGHIDRDVKAGNILIDANGAVKLADFGVSACMFDIGERQRSRNSFVGTPCWMAPEVMQPLHGYDFKADIWSFGITALELAHGHAPFSKHPPMKVLLLTLQNAPPGLDYERDKRFSKSFKEMVAACLVKDPKKRPSSEKLLKHNFFKNGRTNEYLARTILDGLDPLGERFRELKAKDAYLLQNKVVYEDKNDLSQKEYMRGISGWNFNLEDLKAQAALIQSSDTFSMTEDFDKDRCESANFEVTDIVSSENVNSSEAANVREDERCDGQDLEDSLASSFPMLPLQALNPGTPEWKDAMPSNISQVDSLGSKMHEDDTSERISSVGRNILSSDHPKYLSGSVLPPHVIPSGRVLGMLKVKYGGEKGRFKLTAADGSSKSPPSDFAPHHQQQSCRVELTPSPSRQPMLHRYLKSIETTHIPFIQEFGGCVNKKAGSSLSRVDEHCPPTTIGLGQAPAKKEEDSHFFALTVKNCVCRLLFRS